MGGKVVLPEEGLFEAGPAELTEAKEYV